MPIRLTDGAADARRVDIGGMNLPALPGARQPVTLTAPPNGIFQVYAGITTAPSKKCQSDGAKFSVFLVADGKEQELSSATVSISADGPAPAWQFMQADLSAYAGREIQLRLAVQPLTDLRGDLAYWGEPMVLSKGAVSDATPVILISCDTLRADHLSCYGYGRKTSPAIDAFAADATLFEYAFSQETWTLTSHMSMLTGLYPRNHRLTLRSNLAKERVTLAELLAPRGYLTAGYTGILWLLEGWRGYEQGFDQYCQATPYRRLQDTTALVSKWLDSHGSDRFFLFVHNYDAHAKAEQISTPLPYMPDDPQFLRFSKEFDPPPDLKSKDIKNSVGTAFLTRANEGKFVLDENERAYLAALYDDSILQMDAGVGALLEELKKRNLYDRALIILLADHGEMFGEHGGYLHEQIFRPCTHIPLLIRFPGGKFAGRRVADVVQTVDLFPTVADALGVPLDEPRDGQSLLAVMEGSAKPRSYAFTRGDGSESVRDAKWEYFRNLWTGREAFYDVESDPNEMTDLAASNPPEMAEFRRALDAFLVPDPGGWHLRVQNPESMRTVVLMKLSTTDQFESAEFNPPCRGGDIEISQDGKRIEGSLTIGSGETRELIFRNCDPNVPIMAEMKSTQILFARVVTAKNMKVVELNLALDPSNKEYLAPPQTDMGADPIINVWYVPEKAKGEKARELTEHEKEQMKALGYLN